MTGLNKKKKSQAQPPWVCSGCCFSRMTEIICINLHFPLSISIKPCSFPCRAVCTYKRAGMWWHAMPCHLWEQELHLQGKIKYHLFFFVPYMFAPYMRLPGCQRCFESLVTETQEGWALSNEMMKPRSHLSGNSSMKYWLHQAACFGLTSIWNQLEPSGRGCCCHGPNGYCWHWLQVSDRFCSLCSHWPGTCLEGLNHLRAPSPVGGS